MCVHVCVNDTQNKTTPPKTLSEALFCLQMNNYTVFTLYRVRKRNLAQNGSIQRKRIPPLHSDSTQVHKKYENKDFFRQCKDTTFPRNDKISPQFFQIFFKKRNSVCTR